MQAELKASALRRYVRWLESAGMLAAVAADVPAAVARGAVREGQTVLVMKRQGVLETRASGEAWAGAVEAELDLPRLEPAVEVVAVRRTSPVSEVARQIGWRLR